MKAASSIMMMKEHRKERHSRDRARRACFFDFLTRKYKCGVVFGIVIGRRTWEVLLTVGRQGTSAAGSRRESRAAALLLLTAAALISLFADSMKKFLHRYPSTLTGERERQRHWILLLLVFENKSWNTVGK